MITVLALCIAHFFAIVVWISCLNPRAHAKRGLPQHRSEIVREDIQPTPFNSETDSLTSPRRSDHSRLPLSPLSEDHSSHSWAGMQRSVPSSSRKRLPSEKTSSLGHEVISNDIHAPQVQVSRLIELLLSADDICIILRNPHRTQVQYLCIKHSNKYYCVMFFRIAHLIDLVW